MLIVLADAIDLPQEQRLSGRRLAGNARSGLSTDCISWDKSLAGNKTCIRIVCDSVIALSHSFESAEFLPLELPAGRSDLLRIACSCVPAECSQHRGRPTFRSFLGALHGAPLGAW
jgi:hypothetical protein